MNYEEFAEVNLVWATPDLDKNLAYIARVSNPDNQANESIEGLLRFMMREGHVSPFDMANITLEFNTTRDIGRQALRHYSIRPQEFCIAGDSEITLVSAGTRPTKVKIKDLYRYQTDPRMSKVCKFNARVYDEHTKRFTVARIKEVFKTGEKPVYRVTLSDGKVVHSTKEHKFLGRAGWQPLEDLAVGDLVAVNGQPVYQSKEWMQEAKVRCITNATGVQGIADEAEVSYHTIRKWLRIHGLTFSKQETYRANGSKVWNRGLPAEQQPGYGRIVSCESREKMKAASRVGDASEFFKNGSYRDKLQRSHDFAYKYRNRLWRESGEKCCSCSTPTTLKEGHVDHKLPVYAYPELGEEVANLQWLCVPCHLEKSLPERTESSLTVRWREIVDIELIGEEMTYDMEIDYHSHNYVANGIVVHNSQRYSPIEALGTRFLFREFRKQHPTNRQLSVEVPEDDWRHAHWAALQEDVRRAVDKAYTWCLQNGGAKEVARVVLPEGTTPSRLYFNGTIRSWIFYLKSRLDETTQKEHRILAEMVLEELRKAAPVTMNAFFPVE